MHHRFLVLLGVLSLTVSLSVAKPKTGFEGKWVVDRKASQAMPPPPDSLTQVIRVRDGNVQVTSTWRESDRGISPLLYLGIMVSELKLATDGSQSENRFGPFTQATKTTIDGNHMTTEWSANSTDSGSAQGTWIRTLSADGKQMTLEIRQTASDRQSRTGTLVFHRK